MYLRLRPDSAAADTFPSLDCNDWNPRSPV